MEYLTLKNVILVVLVVAVVYYLYTKEEGFSAKHHHHDHHSHHGHYGHHNVHHNSVVTPAPTPALLTAPEVKVEAIHQPAKWNRVSGVDFVGFDLYQTTGANVDECESACAKDPFCTHLAWYPDRNNTCYHKGLHVIGNLNDKYISGFKRENGTYKRHLSNDLSGFDMPNSGRPVPTIEDCEQNCNNSTGCLNYTYGVDNKGCWIKAPVTAAGGVPGTTITTIKP